MDRPRVLLADDHRIVGEGLKSLLADDFDLVGIVEDGRKISATSLPREKSSIASMTSQDLTTHSKTKPPTKLSAKSYSRPVSPSLVSSRCDPDMSIDLSGAEGRW